MWEYRTLYSVLSNNNKKEKQNLDHTLDDPEPQANVVFIKLCIEKTHISFFSDKNLVSLTWWWGVMKGELQPVSSLPMLHSVDVCADPPPPAPFSRLADNSSHLHFSRGLPWSDLCTSPARGHLGTLFTIRWTAQSNPLYPELPGNECRLQVCTGQAEVALLKLDLGLVSFFALSCHFCFLTTFFLKVLG